MFTKGQIVECIATHPDGTLLTLGAIYTVVWSGLAFENFFPVDAVRLAEIPEPEPYLCIPSYYFRPLQDSRLDVFRAMLVQTPAPVFAYDGEDGA